MSFWNERKLKKAGFEPYYGEKSSDTGQVKNAGLRFGKLVGSGLVKGLKTVADYEKANYKNQWSGIRDFATNINSNLEHNRRKGYKL